MKNKMFANAAGVIGALSLMAMVTAAPTTKVEGAVDWKSKLTPEQYHVLREKGTEQAFTGKYDKEKAKGVYHCAGCGIPLFNSETKFDSGTGWPSFYQPIAGQVKLKADSANGMTRTEVVCANCEGHLGHVFNDGPKPTGKRYCLNSVALKLDKAE